MLKITTQTNATGIFFEAEGKLTGPWVQELEDCWRRAAATDQPVSVILKEVTFIDDAGKGLLAKMYRQGAKLMAQGCMTRAIVREIASASSFPKRQNRKQA